MNSAGVLAVFIGIIVFQSNPATGQYDYDDLSVSVFTTYFSSYGLTTAQIAQLDLVSMDATDYGTFLLTLPLSTATAVNNQLVVVNGYIGQIYGVIDNITNIYYATLTKKNQKKYGTIVDTLYASDTTDLSSMPDFPTFQTAAKKLVPTAQWNTAYQAAKAVYTALNANLPAAVPIITSTFGTAFST